MKDQSKTNMNTMTELKTPAPIFIGRWTPKILFSLEGKPYRHGELRRFLGDVSQRMLTRTLRNLESTGLINRRVAGSKALAVEYSLTKREEPSSRHFEACAARQSGMARW
jgi:DNA-binding HxlR family transcriptional regulator